MRAIKTPIASMLISALLIAGCARSDDADAQATGSGEAGDGDSMTLGEALGQLPKSYLDAEQTAALEAAVAAATRTPANVERDRYRHPAQTLAFFGVEPDDTVVEIWPGGGWYTEILAPYLNAGGGRLIVAAPTARGLNGVRALQAKDAETYGGLTLASFPAEEGQDRVADGSADVVLTFRNVHNWRFGGEDSAQEAFNQMFAMLKPGGTLGVVEHRLPEDMNSALEEKSGYMKISSVVEFARRAGFETPETSDINANPADTHDYPDGVWTLPPTYRLKDQDREKYAAIGESDRMTLRFRKPADAAAASDNETGAVGN